MCPPIVDNTPVDAATTNQQKLDRIGDDTAFGKIDLGNTDVASGATVSNIQRLINSFSSALGISTSQVYNYLPTWASDIVGAAFDTFKMRIEAIVARFHGTTGHTHDGTDGQGPTLNAALFKYSQGNDATNGNIDALALSFGSIRLIGTAPVLRGITAGGPGKTLFVMNTSGGNLVVKNMDSNPLAVDRIETGTGADITVQDGGLLLFQYDATSTRWRVTGGAGGGGSVDVTQEVMTGTVDGVNDIFTLSVDPSNINRVIAVVGSRVMTKTTEFILTTYLGQPAIQFQPGFIPAIGEEPYAIIFKPGTGGGGGGGTKIVNHYVTTPEFTAKQFTLPSAPLVATECVAFLRGSGAVLPPLDFQITGGGGDVFDWNGLGLDGVIQDGDLVQIHYSV